MKTLVLVSMLGAVIFTLVPSQASGQEREWSFDTGEEDAYLVFGVPQTDDVGVSFWCTIGAAEIRIFLPEAGESLTAGKTAKIDFDVKGNHYPASGETSANEESGTTSIETRIESGNPFFAALLSADRFSVRVDKEESTFPLDGADFESLIRVCSPQD